MLEIPEVITIKNQLNKTVKNKQIKKVIAASSPHKFAWFSGDPVLYNEILKNKKITRAEAFGGRIELDIEDAFLNFGDGVNLRYYENEALIPKKHQLLIEFHDNTFLIATIAMYGGIWCFKADAEIDDFYYKASKNALSPLSDKFDFEIFKRLINEKTIKMSAKAFLATEQRIPGLGNGVLQDILLNAKIHPKKKMNTLTNEQIEILFQSMKSTLKEMTDNGGRNTERDLLGNFGNYITKLSKNSILSICPNCGGSLTKENYMGGSIYFCECCQEK